MALAAEEYVLRKISQALLYERKKARLLKRVRDIFHILSSYSDRFITSFRLVCQHRELLNWCPTMITSSYGWTLTLSWKRKVSLNGLIKLMHICVLRDLLMCYPTDTYSHVNIAWPTAVVQLSLCVRSSIWYAIRYILRMQEIDLLQNPLKRALRSHEGQDVIIRVITVGDNGRKHLDILRVLATAPQILISANHTLPMIREVQLEHITFGVFPLVGYTLDASWANDSVGDILDMLFRRWRWVRSHEQTIAFDFLSSIRAFHSSTISESRIA